LLVGCLFERRRENIAGCARPGFERANSAEKRLQAVGIGNVGPVITGLAASSQDFSFCLADD
jgi:hypothetical protein